MEFTNFGDSYYNQYIFSHDVIAQGHNPLSTIWRPKNLWNQRFFSEVCANSTFTRLSAVFTDPTKWEYSYDCYKNINMLNNSMSDLFDSVMYHISVWN